MPDEDKAIQEGVTPEPQDAGEKPAAEAGKSAAELQAELDRTAKALKEANKEAASRRKRLDELEAAEKKRADESKTELEKAQARATELEGQLTAQQQAAQERAIKAEIRLQAASMGFNDPDDAYRADVLAAVTVGEDGEVSGVKDALAQLAKDKPYLVGKARSAAPSTEAGVGNLPERGGAVLTPGEQTIVGIAQDYGYHIDPKKIAERKAQARLVAARSEDKE